MGGGGSCYTDLAGFLVKLDFTRECTDGPIIRFRSLSLSNKGCVAEMDNI